MAQSAAGIPTAAPTGNGGWASRGAPTGVRIRPRDHGRWKLRRDLKLFSRTSSGSAVWSTCSSEKYPQPPPQSLYSCQV
ncbi:MAG: hypothetical protein F4017_04830 [Acidimicrobiaceae bacterium]|nr:hypothetical protein [Acidimicrobiaceae bacterium]MYJ43635.1 hypothetical protein [Acidimicrobiaceae bacterium]MYK73904.1 hypothetical protein [Acidimicrobiaceae bacterium]